MPSPIVWCYVDDARGLVLLRGARVRELLDAAGAAELARWSVAGHGHVLARQHLADLAAYADREHIPLRFKEVAT